MKVVIALAFGLISLVSGEDKFRFPSNGTACVLANFDAVFNLTLEYNNETYHTNFPLPPETDIEVDGACVDKKNMAEIRLTLVNESVELDFTLQNKGGEVSADLQVILTDPQKTFKGLNYSSVVALDGTGQEFPNMGSVNNSYLCYAADLKTFMSNDSAVTATASIQFSQVQIQGFNVDGNFSAPSECAADKSSTVSTTVATTTPAVLPSGTGNYTLRNESGGEVCLRLWANISISVNYDNKTGHQVHRDVMVPEDAAVNGTCGEEMIEMTIDLTDGDVQGNVTFIMKKDRGYTFIEGCAFELTLSDSNGTISRSSDDVNDVLALSSMKYQCNREVLALDTDEVILENVQVQAFDVPEVGFSKKSLDCNQPPPKTAPSQNYTVTDGNVTCISLTAAISMQVKYLTTEKKNDTVTINFEKDEPAEGTCSGTGSVGEYIVIKYKKNNFLVRMDFASDKKTSSDLTAAVFNYYVQNVTVTYTLDEELFPNTAEANEEKTAKKTDQKLYQTSSDKYYKCATQSTLQVDDSVSLITSELRLMAFNSDTKQPNLFGDNVNQCSADTETNSIVPIAVGAALAGLVVIVLIAYLIGRRRNHKGYESV